jgi:hypothetical protein
MSVNEPTRRPESADSHGQRSCKILTNSFAALAARARLRHRRSRCDLVHSDVVESAEKPTR